MAESFNADYKHNTFTVTTTFTFYVMIYTSGHPNRHGIAVTKAGRLQCKNIIHVTMPRDVEDWKKQVESCLYTAEENKLSSIAMPALGTGQSVGGLGNNEKVKVSLIELMVSYEV